MANQKAHKSTIIINMFISQFSVRLSISHFTGFTLQSLNLFQLLEQFCFSSFIKVIYGWKMAAQSFLWSKNGSKWFKVKGRKLRTRRMWWRMFWPSSLILVIVWRHLLVWWMALDLHLKWNFHYRLWHFVNWLLFLDEISALASAEKKSDRAIVVLMKKPIFKQV